MIVALPHRPQQVGENHSRAQILESLNGIQLDNLRAILQWIRVTDPLQYEMTDDFPRNEIRTVFIDAGFTESVTRLQSLSVGNAQVHARRLVCFWLHQIRRVKKKRPPYDVIVPALDEWFSHYETEA